MNKENERESKVEKVEIVRQEIRKLSKDEGREAFKRMKNERQLVMMAYQ